MATGRRSPARALGEDGATSCNPGLKSFLAGGTASATHVAEAVFVGRGSGHDGRSNDDHRPLVPSSSIAEPRASSARIRPRYPWDLVTSAVSALTVLAIVSRAATLNASIWSMVA